MATIKFSKVSISLKYSGKVLVSASVSSPLIVGMVYVMILRTKKGNILMINEKPFLVSDLIDNEISVETAIFSTLAKELVNQVSK